jgi:transcription initiation factor TFIIH subunit 2
MRRRHLAPALASVQRGMLRNLFLVIDFSRGMEASDLKPTRAAATAKAATDFVQEYFDANPISQMGIIITRRGVAEKLTDLGGNPRRHIAALTDALRAPRALEGDMTLQTSLDLAARHLALQPKFGTREVLLVHGALSTRDPGAIGDTIAALRAERVRVSVISLPGEVYVAARVAKETGGTYGVPESYDALRSLVLAHCQPPARRAEDEDAGGRQRMVRVGFPELVQESEGLCACHHRVMARAYVCPRCCTRCCEIPTECAVCGLQLVSAPGLARSYHHLFPVPVFVEVPSAHAPGVGHRGSGEGEGEEDAVQESAGGGGGGGGGEDDGMGGGGEGAYGHGGRRALFHDSSPSCGACLVPLAPDKPRYVCPACRMAVCADCDQLVHETLHNCPGCAGR